MIPYTLRIRHFRAIAVGLFAVSTSLGMAQPPLPEDSPNSAKQDRLKPQIIYHLSSASHETAEALHAQSKAADTSLSLSQEMPLSLQLARAHANAEAVVTAKVSPVPEAPPNGKSVREQKVAKASVRRGAGGNRARASKRGNDAGSHGNGRGHGHYRQ